jgi:hypothetical protein
MLIIRGTITARREEKEKVVIEIENKKERFGMAVSEEYYVVFRDFTVGKGIILSTDELESCGIKDNSSLGKCAAQSSRDLQDGRSLQNGCSLHSGKPMQNFTYCPSIQATLDSSCTISNLSIASCIDLYTVVMTCRPLMEIKGTDYLFTLGIADKTGNIDLRVFVSGSQDLE